MRSAKRAAVERSCVIIKHREAAVAELVEDAEDPGAHRDVEHRDRLVGDEQLRAEDEARRDRDALALATGELVRVAVGEELGGRETDLLQRLGDRGAALGARPDPVDDERLGDGRRDAEARVERLVGILVDDLHPTSKRP